MQWWLLSTFFLVISSKVIQGSGVFELQLLSFKNPLRLDNEGGCCSGVRTNVCSGWCQTYFRVCISHYQQQIDHQSECTFGLGATPVLGYNSNYNFTQGYVAFQNPFRFPFAYTWPRFFTLIVEGFHQDQANDPESSGSQKLIIRKATQRFVAAGPKWTPDHASNQHGTELIFQYRVLCDPRFFGDNCTDVCSPRDDPYAGHYTCGQKGERVCLSGWTGHYCTDAICLNGCHKQHGFCEKPGECKCRHGYTGQHCDQCRTYPGCQQGTCNHPWECNCLYGWGGMLCNRDLNFCLTHKPCTNGGTCTNEPVGFYTCICPPGTSGNDCEIFVDTCDASPCLNGGTCMKDGKNYTCNCKPGFKGRDCEKKVHTCADNPCSNGATCIDNAEGYECQCTQGYKGNHCELEDKGCTEKPCLNGGLCIDDFSNPKGYKCICPSEYKGDICQEATNDCEYSPCVNGGTCIQRGKQVMCLCEQGFMGFYCQININECDMHPCRNGATCIDGVNDFTCECLPGFTGRDCSTNVDDCESHPCENGGTCEDQINGFICFCPYGYTGPACETLLPGFSRIRDNNPDDAENEVSAHTMTEDRNNSEGHEISPTNTENFSSKQVALVTSISLILIICLVIMFVLFIAYRRNRSKHFPSDHDICSTIEHQTRILNNVDTTILPAAETPIYTTPTKPKAIKSTNIDYETYTISATGEKVTKEGCSKFDDCYKVAHDEQTLAQTVPFTATTRVSNGCNEDYSYQQEYNLMAESRMLNNSFLAFQPSKTVSVKRLKTCNSEQESLQQEEKESCKTKLEDVWVSEV